MAPVPTFDLVPHTNPGSVGGPLYFYHLHSYVGVQKFQYPCRKLAIHRVARQPLECRENSELLSDLLRKRAVCPLRNLLKAF